MPADVFKGARAYFKTTLFNPYSLAIRDPEIAEQFSVRKFYRTRYAMYFFAVLQAIGNINLLFIVKETHQNMHFLHLLSWVPLLLVIIFSKRFQSILHYMPSLLLMIRLSTVIYLRKFSLESADSENEKFSVNILWDTAFFVLNILVISLLCTTHFVGQVCMQSFAIVFAFAYWTYSIQSVFDE